jgi:arylsulfatase A-like enzyme
MNIDNHRGRLASNALPAGGPLGEQRVTVGAYTMFRCSANILTTLDSAGQLIQDQNRHTRPRRSASKSSSCLTHLRHKVKVIMRGPSASLIAALHLGVLVLAACSPAASHVVADNTRPNVVLIMTDDQGYGDLSRHGNPILRTPNLDQLAEQSIRLTDFHVAPVCTPTRGQLLTGLDALRNGASSATGQRFLLKRGLTTMAEVFSANGYRTAMYGKWHLGGNFLDFRPHERGFDDAVWFLRGGVQSTPNYWNSDLMDDFYFRNGKYEQFKGYATDVWFELGTEFVKESSQSNRPFFLYLPLNAPHAPLLVPDHYRAPYRHLDKNTATFFGMIANVDERIGQFLSMLEDEKLRENTIVIFLTDNGTAYGQDVHNAGMRGRKGSLYDGGHRVPFFISWPNGELRGPSDVDALAQAQDVLPTLIELCNLQAPSGLQFDGISLAPLLRGAFQPELESRMLVVQQADHKGPGTVMWKKWRLVENELYNVEEDRGQEVDLAVRHPDIVERMRVHYDRWWSGVEPHLPLERFRIGSNEEVKLTAYDWWHGRRVPNWPHLRRGDTSNGRFELTVDIPGTYRVALRRWPRESGAGIRDSVPAYVPFDSYMSGDPLLDNFPSGKAYDVRRARIRFGEFEEAKLVEGNEQEVTFTFHVPSGEADLQTWFATADGEEFGAHYVYIQRVTE